MSGNSRPLKHRILKQWSLEPQQQQQQPVKEAMEAIVASPLPPPPPPLLPAPEKMEVKEEKVVVMQSVPADEENNNKKEDNVGEGNDNKIDHSDDNKIKVNNEKNNDNKVDDSHEKNNNSKVNDGNKKNNNNNNNNNTDTDTDTGKDKRYHVTRITDKSFCPETGEILFRMHWDGRQFSEDSNALERQKMKRKTFVPDDEKWQGPTEVGPGCSLALTKCETKWKAESGSGAIDLRDDDDDLTFLADHQVLAASRYLRQLKSAEHQVIRLAAIYPAGEICPGSRRQFRFDFSNRVSLTIPQDMLKLLSPANKRRVQEMLRANGKVIPAPVGAAH